MSSTLYTANSTATAVAAGGTIPLGSIIRRKGCNCNLTGNGIVLSGAGYYDINASFTILGTAAGNATITLYKDGVAIPTATSTVTTASGEYAEITIPAVVRNQCCASSIITAVLSTTGATIAASGIVVEKE